MDAAEIGYEAMDAEDYGRALAAFEKAVELCPNYPIYWYDVARTQREIGSYQSALTAIDIAIKLDESEPQFRHARGNIMRSLNNLEEAVDEFKRALDLDESFPAHNNLGLTYHDLGELDLARDVLEQGLNFAPEDTDLLMNLASVYCDMDKFAVAALYDERVVRLNPNIVRSWERLANDYFCLKQFDQAEVAMREAIARGHDTAEAYSVLGDILLSAGKVEEAKVAFEIAHSRSHQ